MKTSYALLDVVIGEQNSRNYEKLKNLCNMQGGGEVTVSFSLPERA